MYHAKRLSNIVGQPLMFFRFAKYLKISKLPPPYIKIVRLKFVLLADFSYLCVLLQIALRVAPLVVHNITEKISQISPYASGYFSLVGFIKR